MSGLDTSDHIVELGTTQLRYRVHHAEADRPPLVLLHPWFGCPGFWDETVAALTDRTRYVPALYSLGDGDWREHVGPAGLAAAIVAMLEQENIDSCDLAGNSMGGIAAQLVAASQGERIRRLILIGTGATAGALSPSYRAAIDDWLLGDPDGFRTAAFVRRLLATEPAPDIMARYVADVRAGNPEFMGATLAAALGLDIRPLLPRITAETLVIRGSLDAGRTPEHVRELVSGIAGSRAVELAGAGHSPMVDSFAAFLATMRDFLDADQGGR
ncbi:MAG: alpha/beta hydrolase fold protein [Frankiales bacterium]|nr:alpha/beta hydrolase fold protein [Frankiales bacterium]